VRYAVAGEFEVLDVNKTRSGEFARPVPDQGALGVGADSSTASAASTGTCPCQRGCGTKSGICPMARWALATTVPTGSTTRFQARSSGRQQAPGSESALQRLANSH